MVIKDITGDVYIAYIAHYLMALREMGTSSTCVRSSVHLRDLTSPTLNLW